MPLARLGFRDIARGGVKRSCAGPRHSIREPLGSLLGSGVRAFEAAEVRVFGSLEASRGIGFVHHGVLDPTQSVDFDPDHISRDEPLGRLHHGAYAARCPC